MTGRRLKQTLGGELLAGLGVVGGEGGGANRPFSLSDSLLQVATMIGLIFWRLALLAWQTYQDVCEIEWWGVG